MVSGGGGVVCMAMISFKSEGLTEVVAKFNFMTSLFL